VLGQMVSWRRANPAKSSDVVISTSDWALAPWTSTNWQGNAKANGSGAAWDVALALLVPGGVWYVPRYREAQKQYYYPILIAQAVMPESSSQVIDRLDSRPWKVPANKPCILNNAIFE
jgi:hypothetical protein